MLPLMYNITRFMKMVAWLRKSIVDKEGNYKYMILLVKLDTTSETATLALSLTISFVKAGDL